ncbi:C40 family peptidase [Hufsiella ginkgonis]|uniref:Hydrolase Nlp/P60 n=1 Tax=Hufsiella ginkgonis TaxID=2695274 RepID=A0A7K1XVW2_9SPHI|nr:C40 family peptidase [Hufsiella ginkgonis]MXV15133.1 hydrolase Nlp/P60 [Hufsiella ginkgonis]
MEHSFGICNLSVVPMRAEPSDRSELTNQLLFGDRLRVVNKENNWTLVQSVYDNYMGWIDFKQYAPVTLEEFINWEDHSFVTGIHGSFPLDKTSAGQKLALVPGSSIPVSPGAAFSINNDQYLAPAGLLVPGQANFKSEIAQTARFYLNAPYLWGGRSPYGIDCSGFCQVVFKLFGIPLKRDAAQQALQGETVHFLPEATAGDLAFFDNEDGKIIHVGILLDQSTLIHASGRVKIDAIDDQGIYSDELRRYTHKLRIIRRFVS